MLCYALISLIRKRQGPRLKRVFKGILGYQILVVFRKFSGRKNPGTMPEKVSIPDTPKRVCTGKMEELSYFRHPARALSEKF
jgi:hypothetical protein